MKRIFIIHRWGGETDGDWYPWLASEIEKEDCKVFLLKMPDSDTPVIKKWVSHLAKAVGTPDSETYFVGHSIGCQTILRYLETVKPETGEPVGGAVFVAGWFKLENLEDDETKAVAKPWMEQQIDLEKVKKILPKSTLIISDNDPYGAFEINKKQFKKLGSKIVTLNNAGHITAYDGHSEVPEILAEFKKLLV